ncbi:molybdenum cofactor guanylyltransferase [Synechococcus sp. CS-1332]|uniref:molybdenum cofactor guanylyltransferase n=1 Tax=Synechococcus sp. CS-1332 TaxID=2847972 RepID=UPI00223B3DD3|nr:molybdenum cofactor guanylyltransferase [Synechococcus sp. CS-1332]MCT0207289.1 molybdenum cofactor guanylyltransferase [Synechococcus sp. CS-1332]
MSGLRACLLSGGASRRMGTDKALLPHPTGGTWLEFSLAQLAALPLPITLVSHHRAHQALARPLRDGLGDAISVLEEPPPREGPLLALDRLMQLYPDDDLLLCPVDMPWLETAALQALVAAATSPAAPAAIHLAHDGRRLQPLLGIYPAHASRRQGLRAFTAAGGRRLQDWLAGEEVVAEPLPAAGLRNANRPDAAAGLWP